MLQIENLHAYYGLSHVLQGVTLQGAPGEVVGLFGRNGVGKTTILKTVAGWLAPARGSIKVAGQEIGGHEPDEICRRGVGLVPEDRRIFPGLSVEENLRLGLLQVAGRDRAGQKAALEKAYESFPRLAERRKQLGTTLSGGEQQMLAIARVLVGEPHLLLVDEPTEGLAPFLVEEIGRILSELKGGDMTIVLVEQNVHWALGLADRFYVIERGQVQLTGDTAREDDRNQLFEAISV